MSQLLKDEIIRQVEPLGDNQQQQILNFARSLFDPLPRGISGEALIRLLGTLPPEDVESMKQAMEECGRIDPLCSKHRIPEHLTKFIEMESAKR